MKVEFLAAALSCAAILNAQSNAATGARGLNYNASKSNTGNIIISDGTNCTTVVVTADATGNITGSTSTTVSCTVPNGEYIVAGGDIQQTVTEIPQFVDGGGWQTTLVISNTTASPATASVTFYQESAAADGTTVPWTPTFLEVNSTQNLALAPGATIFLHTPGTAAALSLGWGQVTASDGVQSYALFTWSATSGGQGSAPATTGVSDVLLPFDNTAVNGTAVAIANPTSASETVFLSFQTDSGAISQSSMTLPAMGHKAFLLRSQFPSSSGNRGIAEFTTSNPGGISLIGLQFNPVDNFTTAQAYGVNNGPIIIGLNPLTCLENPTLSGCPSPAFLMLTLTATFTSGTGQYPVQINITPATNGTYNAAITGMVGGTNVNGSFIGGVIETGRGSGQPITFNFPTIGGPSTFTAGSFSFNLSETGYDAASGEAEGTVSGQIALTQNGAAGGLISGRCIYIYFPGID